MTATRANRPCPQNTQVDAYFAGRLSPSRQGGLRAHLDGCDDCRGRFGRHQRLAALDPAALPFEERVGRALGLRTGGSVARWRGAPALIGVLAVGMVLLVGRSSLPGWLPGGFAARGPDEPRALILNTPGVEVLAFRTDQPAATLQTGQLPGAAELAFAYRNRGGWPFLMVFARDEIGNVYWYQPSWTDGRADPQAVALSADARAARAAAGGVACVQGAAPDPVCARQRPAAVGPPAGAAAARRRFDPADRTAVFRGT